LSIWPTGERGMSLCYDHELSEKLLGDLMHQQEGEKENRDSLREV